MSLNINQTGNIPTPTETTPPDKITGHLSNVLLMGQIGAAENIAYTIPRSLNPTTANELDPPAAPFPFWLGMTGLPRTGAQARQLPYPPGDMNLDRGAIPPDMKGPASLLQVIKRRGRK